MEHPFKEKLNPLTYAQLVEVFGEPNCEGDGYKVSTEWVLSDGKIVVTLYDYKETNLYSEGLPTIEHFRERPYEWHIGAFCEEDAIKFNDYLNSII